MGKQRAMGWIVGNDTGASSKAIWAHMMGVGMPTEWGWSGPADPDDFGRCYRLLELMPEWRERMKEMAANCGPEWAAIAPAWNELESLWREEGDGTSRPPFGTQMPRLYSQLHKLRWPNGQWVGRRKQVA